MSRERGSLILGFSQGRAMPAVSIAIVALELVGCKRLGRR